VLATGNDTRAIEAGAHVYASRSGIYRPLSCYEKNANGDLVATIEMPMAVGLVGGATKTNPIARAAVKILGVKSATEMGEVFAALVLPRISQQCVRLPQKASREAIWGFIRGM